MTGLWTAGSDNTSPDKVEVDNLLWLSVKHMTTVTH